MPKLNQIFTPQYIEEIESLLLPLLSLAPGNAAFTPLETALIQSATTAVLANAAAKVSTVAAVATPTYSPAVSAALTAGPTQAVPNAG